MLLFDDEEPLSSYEVPLQLSSTGEEFHTLNASPEDYERGNVIERTEGSIHIYCDLMDVKHGNLGANTNDKNDLATLMVFRFRIDTQKNSRRVYRARVRIEFFPADRTGSRSTPIVEAIAPEGRWSLMPTTDAESLTKGAEVDLGVSGPSIVNASTKVTLQKTKTRDITSSTIVSGSMNLGKGKNAGVYTAANWNLLENEKRSSGVPDSILVALRLTRHDEERFNAEISLSTEADIATRFGNLFGRKVRLDDPVLFNPQAQSELKHSKKGRLYGAQNLGDIDLYSLCGASMSSDAFWAK
ncbi:hypothetical protein N0V93_010345 [Gnomoniopsis smithogilvyi]|uniref:Uncharacterized protein n=1 Tax=Gnomoniopsis smithogilvyi TaxID=1191159 RepID=A0A9W8YKQ6_9PEZI|nr:hypothetical protein N0V93_010345 [Gnomoniopsis smithogilvyi]